jgi:S-methylmethionine-dependent homocysteine/selenocysteine methylase
MPSKKITDRLIDGEILLLDGGTGSELQRRGVNVLKDATDKLEAWSATANINNPDVVQQVHQDYLRVGADIITSNNFWTIPTAMEWREMGAQIIGGCCATGPEHILAMKPVVKG